MNLIESCVRNPVKVAVGVIMVVMFGILAIFNMPMQLVPEVQVPTITIETRWPGASPQEIEQEIIVEQEEQLKSVEGVVKMSSDSADSMGTITMEFAIGSDMEESLLKVNSRLQQVPEYPEDADLPVLSTASSSSRPIAWFIFSPRRPSNEQIDALVAKHPELKGKLAPARRAVNAGLAMLRLRLLAKEYPAVNELLPPEDMDVTKLGRFAEDEIESRFERVQGVAQSNVIGGLEDELQVIVDPEKLAARQLTLTDVRRVLQSQNEDTSAGDFWEGQRRWVVRALGEFRTPEQVGHQLLAVRDGKPVYVSDVARVELGYKKPQGIVRRFGQNCIAINCIRETSANVLDVMADLDKVCKDIDKNILAPRGLQLSQVYDETEYINSAVGLVNENIMVGGALTMVVLLCFLHLNKWTLLVSPMILGTALAATYGYTWVFGICIAIILAAGITFARGALVIGLAIFTSIIGTFLVMHMLGRSLNVISLAGLAFAVGMLVDNAIVVLENIFRRYTDLGESPLVASVRGTQEVWGAIIASTLTNAAVFVPVLFVQEEVGQLFRDIALAITAALLLSLVVAATLVPAATARLFKRRKEVGSLDVVSGDEAEAVTSSIASSAGGESAAIQRWLRPLEWMGEKFVELVVGINAWVLGTRLRQIAVTILMVVASVGISWAIWPAVEYLPSGNQNLVFGILLPPPGYNINKMLEMGETVEANLRPYWDVDPGSPEAEKLDGPAIGDFFFVARGRQVFIGIRAQDPTKAAGLVKVVQSTVATLPGTIGVASQQSLFETNRGVGAGRTIDIEITGPDLKELVGFGGQIFGQVLQMVPGGQARPMPSLDLSSPEIHVEPKLWQAADMLISSSDLGFAVNALVDGAYVSDYFHNGKKVDLTVMGEERFANSTQDISALPISTPLGQLVPLAALADVNIRSGPEQIAHRERVRAITILATPPPEVPLESALDIIQTQIVDPLEQSGRLGEHYRVTLAGTADKLRQTWLALRYNLLLALVITYLLMAALFESWLYPLVIIMSVPLGAVGGIAGIQILNLFIPQPLDVLTMLGFVILVGTVVNNPILIVHQSLNYIREEGMTPQAAILESTRTRIRPIFMTTITALLGLLPLVLFPGAGSELYRGLGSVLLGGLVVTTLFTLVQVPALFSLAMDAKGGLAKLFFGHSEEEEKARREELMRPRIAETDFETVKVR